MYLFGSWKEHPRVRTGPLAAMADDILAHADCVMLADHARLTSYEYWDAYIAAALGITGETAPINRIQQAQAEVLMSADRVVSIPPSRYGRIMRQQMKNLYDKLYNNNPQPSLP